VPREARVDDGHVGSRIREDEGEVGADEAESAGDEAPPPRERVDGRGIQRPVSIGERVVLTWGADGSAWARTA
jgi:hypothetical protein